MRKLGLLVLRVEGLEPLQGNLLLQGSVIDSGCCGVARGCALQLQGKLGRYKLRHVGARQEASESVAHALLVPRWPESGDIDSHGKLRAAAGWVARQVEQRARATPAALHERLVVRRRYAVRPKDE
jgi:hypothetical protein